MVNWNVLNDRALRSDRLAAILEKASPFLMPIRSLWNA
jgi:hypothetical protein